MKKPLMILALALACLAAQAQGFDSSTDGFSSGPVSKYKVSTNTFWQNWFVQANLTSTAFYSDEEFGPEFNRNPFKSFRNSIGFSASVGKWFTPGLGMRTKFNGIWGRTVMSDDKDINSSKFFTLNEHVLFNMSNLLYGYNERRVWNLSLFAGGGFGRNMSYNTWVLGLSAGMLNTFRISPRLRINAEIMWGIYEPGFDGLYVSGSSNKMSIKNKDTMLSFEVGLTYNIGKYTWEKTPDVEAERILSQGQIDALNAQLADMHGENERLRQQLASAQKPAPKAETRVETKLISAPVSVFFNIDSHKIANRKELKDVEALAELAKKSGATLTITGYADSHTGNAEHNQRLSQRRADALADELVSMGVDRSKIETVAKGGVDMLTPPSYNRRAVVEIKQ